MVYVSPLSHDNVASDNGVFLHYVVCDFEDIEIESQRNRF